MNNVTAIVISFLRPKYTIDCIKSLKKTYPKIGDILVGENAEYNEEIENAVFKVGGKYIQLEYDSGVPAGRNRLMDLVKTKYVLVGDDDFLYDKKAKVDKMVKFLEENPEFDLIGGRVFENGQVKNYQGYIDIYDDHLDYIIVHENEVTKKDKKSGLRYKKVDLTFNFFIARVESIRDVPWDEHIKVAFEHSHWFINLKKNNKVVAFSPDPIVDHKKQGYGVSNEYKKFRLRKSDRHYFFDSLGIEYAKGMRGEITRKEVDGNKKYYAKESLKVNGKKYGAGDIVILKNKQPKGVMEKLRRA